MEAETLSVKIKAETGNLNSSLNKVQTQLKSTGTAAAAASSKLASIKKAAVAIGSAVVSVKALTAAYKELSSAASDQITAETKLDTVMRTRMGSNNAEIQSIKEYCAQLQEIGVVGDEVAIAGAAQMASFVTSSNSLRTLIPAMENLATAQNGVNVTASSMTSIANQLGKALANGSLSTLARSGITVTDEDTEKFKALATEEEKCAFLADLISRNYGEMNKALANTYAGKVVQLKNNFGDLKEMLGGLLQTALYPFISGLNTALVAVKNLLGSLGISIGTTKDATSSVASSLASANKSSKGTSSNLSSAAKSANAIKGALSGFDDLNVLSDSSSDSSDSGSSGSTGSTGGTTDLSGSGTYDIDMTGLQKKIAEVKKQFESWVPILELIALLAAGIVIAFNWESITLAIAGVTGFLVECVGEFGIFEGLAMGIDNMFGGTFLTGMVAGFEELAAAVGVSTGALAAIIAVVVLVVAALADLWDDASKIADLFRGAVSTALQNLGSLINSVYSTFIKPFFLFFEGVWETVQKPLQIFWEYFKEAVGGISLVFLGLWNVIEPALEILINILGAVLQPLFKTIGQVVGSVIGGILIVLTPFLKVISEVTTAIYTGLLKPLGDALSKAAKYTKNGAQVMSDAMSGLGKAFKTVWGVIKGVINWILGGIETLVNNAITGINKLLEPLTKVGNKILKAVGIKSFSFEAIGKVSIPRLATGGIVTSSTLANIGENGAEAVVPLERNTQWIDMLADRINGSNEGSGNTYVIQLVADGEVLTQKVIKNIKNYQNMTGRSVFG